MVLVRILCFFVFTLLASAEQPLPAKVSFNRDIRPIMSDTCFHCHGFDPKTREAGLRLDLREAAITATEDGVVGIVPGNPEKSEIIARILDEEDPMPPEKAHKPLTERQKKLFRQWVAEGAVYEPHWAYAPLNKPAPPPGTAHPIDAFIQAPLKEKGVAPSPEAPPAKLLRRLSLDLIGLPPRPAEVAASQAYEVEVDRLLGSQHFGERMAVWWLDIARYADTVGFHGDQNQRIYPYRDYVINAFNTNKRFDQFTLEQLAGDLLPNPSTEQRVATGYNRLNMMTREGGAQAKEYLAKYGAERVRSVAAAWLGSTFGCAECHDHKFDPILTRDFYELQAFFADVKQWGVYSDYGYTPEPELKGFNNEAPFPPEIEVESPWMKKRHAAADQALNDHLTTTVKKLQSDTKAVAAQAAWEQRVQPLLQAGKGGWLALKPSAAVLLREGKPLPQAKKKGKAPAPPGPVISAAAAVSPGAALGKKDALEVRFAGIAPSTLAAIRAEVDLEGLDPKKVEEKLGKTLTLSLKLQPVTGKARAISLRKGEATSKRPIYKSGDELTGLQNEWRLPYTLPADRKLSAVWLLTAPLSLASGDQLVATLTGDNTLPVRFNISPLGSVEPQRVADADILAALSALPGKRSPAQSALATETFLFSSGYDRAAVDQSHTLAAEKQRYNEGRAWSLVTQAAAKPLTLRVLPRGNWQDETGPVVLPSTPSFLPGRMQSSEAQRLTRLDLARWLVSKENPITARAVMNRLWAMLFGTGLSAAVDDLGSQGEPPSHPELLDWLASEFRDSGWDVKHMVRLMVTSHTYRQNSSLRPETKEYDPANRLLASQNPRRLDAEFVRDNALAIAGLLNLEDIGGPSVKPYQPVGYYAALQFPDRDYVADTDDRQWRRGLYTHWQRTFLHPMLANFDAPARDECAAMRTTSNTPQQALTLLNDPTFVEAARALAQRIIQSATSQEERLALAYTLALARQPKAEETQSMLALLASQEKHYQANPEDAGKLLKVGLSKANLPDAASHAAWTQVCRVLLNAQETLTRY